MRKNRLNFTLMELLIVMGIIAVLASMLLPALKTARNAASGIVCLSNIKQLGSYFFSYSDDFDGYMMSASASFGNYWAGYLNTLYNLPFQDYSTTSHKLLKCPSRSSNELKKCNIFPTTYGINDGASRSGNTLYKIYTAKTPLKTILLGENHGGSITSAFDYHPETINWNGSYVICGYLDFRHHNRKASFVFFDGHAELRTPSNTASQHFYPNLGSNQAYNQTYFWKRDLEPANHTNVVPPDL